MGSTGEVVASRAQKNAKRKGDGHEHSYSHVTYRPRRRCADSGRRRAGQRDHRRAAGPGAIESRRTRRRLPSKIVGGTCAAPGEFPWQVVLYSRVSKTRMALACGGSLVAPNWVLTAASCLTGWSVQPQDWTAVSDVKKAPVLEVPSDATSRAVKRIIVHEDYNDKNLANDIALVELASPVSAKPIALQLTADPAVEENHDVTITGWGYTRGVKRKTDGQGHPINDDHGNPIYVDTETGERVDPLKVYLPGPAESLDAARRDRRMRERLGKRQHEHRPTHSLCGAARRRNRRVHRGLRRARRGEKSGPANGGKSASRAGGRSLAG